MEPRLSVQLKQHQQLSQEKIQSLQLLHMTSVEIQDEIDLMLDDNPVLEHEESSPNIEETLEEKVPDTPNRETQEDERVSDTEAPLEAMYADWRLPTGESSFIEQIAAKTDFREELLAELRCLPYDRREACLIACLIEELDERGFLVETTEKIARDYDHILKEAGIADASPEEWRLALERLRRMDPPGIGAQSPVEAMILQAERLAENDELAPETLSLVRQILRRDLLELARKNRRALLKLAGQNEALLNEALALLNTLTPYPIHGANDAPQYVVPDIIVEHRNGLLTAVVPSGLCQSVRIKSKTEVPELSSSLVSRYANEARGFLRGLRARQETLQKIGDILVREQYAFFTDGPSALKPWKIGDLAKELGINDSTVSRAVDGKFVLSEGGMFELRSFFSTAGVRSRDAHGQPVEEMGSAQISALIAEMIAAEDAARPLTDDALALRLKEKNIAIARRTVAKYREMAGIPSARVRKRH